MSANYLRKISLLFLLNILFMSNLFSSRSFAEDGIVFAQSEVSILSRGHSYKFNVEVADRDDLRARGLMFRTQMADRNGMLFFFKKNQMIIMWMKNTFIPLDILFINQEGVIVHIAKSTVPESLDYISSGEAVISALEVNAGITNRLNIKVGDKIDHVFFNPSSK